MSKDVLIISGSARLGGNSDRLCDEFADGARAAGHAVEKVRLQEKTIAPCIACYRCKDAGVCVQRDDMAGLLERLVEAEVLVLATPVYFYDMSAQMKAMIDRTVARYLDIRDKEIYLIGTAAAGSEAVQRAFNGLQGFVDCLPGAQVKGRIYGAGVYEKGEIEGHRELEDAYELGKGV